MKIIIKKIVENNQLMKAHIEVTSLHVWCLDKVNLALCAAACREREVFYKKTRYVVIYIYILIYIYIHTL